MNKYLDWASHEYPLRRRLVILFVLGTLFLGLFPLLLVRGSARLDRRLRLRHFRAGIISTMPASASDWRAGSSRSRPFGPWWRPDPGRRCR